jgi:hypothetical protein
MDRVSADSRNEPVVAMITEITEGSGMPDWLYILARALLVILLAYTAYVSFRRMRAARRRMTTFDWLTLAVAIPLMGGGLILLIYGLIVDWPAYVTAIVILYYMLAFYLYVKLSRWIEASFPPKVDSESAGAG